MIYDKVDEHGKRYRELGKGCIEFEPTVSINGLEIPQSELAVYNAARRAAQERAAKIRHPLKTPYIAARSPRIAHFRPGVIRLAPARNAACS